MLEPAAEQFADATAKPPFLFDLGREKGRETVDEGDRLIRELAVVANVSVVFPTCSLSPEAKYPTAIEESWTSFAIASAPARKRPICVRCVRCGKPRTTARRADRAST